MDRSKRKIEHINNALATSGQSNNNFSDVLFVHQSLPNISVESTSLRTKLGELSLSSPFFINGMTGGGGEATYKINKQLAIVAAEYNLPIAVGSQMAAIKDPSQKSTYSVVRENHPNGIVFANLGAEASLEHAKRAIDMLGANGIQIHLNAIQELVMPEGDRDFSKWLFNIEKIVNGIDKPVIIKEVGFGISFETARLLKDVGVQIIDVGGYGGTNFSVIENLRREEQLQGFNNWGIPTPISIVEVSSKFPSIDLVASGGIRDSFDVAKALALGANAVGFAGNLLKVLHDSGIEGLIAHINQLLTNIKYIMTGLGVRTIAELQKTPLIISGHTYHWLEQRGIDTKLYSNRMR